MLMWVAGRWLVMLFISFLSCLSRLCQFGNLVKWLPSLDWWVSCYLVFLGIKVKRNNQIGTVASWGPTFRVAFDFIVHSAGSWWGSILRFTSTNHDWSHMGDRLPAIFLYRFSTRRGSLQITTAVGKNANYAVYYKNIDLKKWYHIEIAQTKMNGKVSEINNFLLLI